MYSFPNFKSVCCFMYSSNCCFLTCVQISQEAGQVVWYSNLLKNFPQFVVIHTVKGFSEVNKAEVDVFLEVSCFIDDPADVGNLISDSSAFSKSSLNIYKFKVPVLLKPGLWHCTGDSNQDHPQEKEMQKGKMVVWGGLTDSWEEKLKAKEKKIYPSECRVPKNSKER